MVSVAAMPQFYRRGRVIRGIPMSLIPGTRLGSYEIVAAIGAVVHRDRELGDRLGAPITGLNPFGGLRCGGEPVTHAAHEIVVVQNFFEEMKRLAPAR
jgi:hypothetical protein